MGRNDAESGSRSSACRRGRGARCSQRTARPRLVSGAISGFGLFSSSRLCFSSLLFSYIPSVLLQPFCSLHSFCSLHFLCSLHPCFSLHPFWTLTSILYSSYLPFSSPLLLSSPPCVIRGTGCHRAHQPRRDHIRNPLAYARHEHRHGIRPQRATQKGDKSPGGSAQEAARSRG
jgi:hypothetical protein